MSSRQEFVSRAPAALAAVVALALVSACGGDDGAKLTLRASIVERDGMISFISPTASVIAHPRSALVGKPYYSATFPAGFSPGNDPAIDHAWGFVPEDLQIEVVTPASYPDGAYDMVLVIYVSTPISAEQMASDEFPPAATGGDVATFTLSQAEVRPGDPEIIPGVVRFNVEGGDATVEVENRIPMDLMDGNQIMAAMTNTLMIVP